MIFEGEKIESKYRKFKHVLVENTNFVISNPLYGMASEHCKRLTFPLFCPCLGLRKEKMLHTEREPYLIHLPARVTKGSGIAQTIPAREPALCTAMGTT